MYSNDLKFAMKSQVDPSLMFSRPKKEPIPADALLIVHSSCTFSSYRYTHVMLFLRYETLLIPTVSYFIRNGTIPNPPPAYAFMDATYLLSEFDSKRKSVRPAYNAIELCSQGDAGAAASAANAEDFLFTNRTSSGNFATLISTNQYTILQNLGNVYNYSSPQDLHFYYFGRVGWVSGVWQAWYYPRKYAKTITNFTISDVTPVPLGETITGDFKALPGFQSVVFNNRFVNIPFASALAKISTNKLWTLYPETTDRLFMLKFNTFNRGYMIIFPIQPFTQYIQMQSVDAEFNFARSFYSIIKAAPKTGDRAIISLTDYFDVGTTSYTIWIFDLDGAGMRADDFKVLMGLKGDIRSYARTISNIFRGVTGGIN